MTARRARAHARGAGGRSRDSGRQALGELRRLLGLLQEGADGAPVAPQPGPRRPRRARRAAPAAPALHVALHVDGDLAGLPPSTDLAAFRIVQEALTNALRHARTPTGVACSIRRADGADASRCATRLAGATQAFAGGAGHGLAGMRERVRVFGGDARRRARDDGELRGARRPADRRRPHMTVGARGRRPGAGARRPAHDPRALRRPRGRSARRPTARAAVRERAPPAARRRADGRPDARAGRDRGHARAGRGTAGGPPARARAHHLRPRRIRLRGAARRAPAASCSRTRRPSGSWPPFTPCATARRCWRRRSRAGWSSASRCRRAPLRPGSTS